MLPLTQSFETTRFGPPPQTRRRDDCGHRLAKLHTVRSSASWFVFWIEIWSRFQCDPVHYHSHNVNSFNNSLYGIGIVAHSVVLNLLYSCHVPSSSGCDVFMNMVVCITKDSQRYNRCSSYLEFCANLPCFCNRHVVASRPPRILRTDVTQTCHNIVIFVGRPSICVISKCCCDESVRGWKGWRMCPRVHMCSRARVFRDSTCVCCTTDTATICRIRLEE